MIKDEKNQLEIQKQQGVIGVEPVDSDAMYQSIKSGKRVTLASVGIFADGVAVRTIGKQTFELCRQYVDEIVRVNTDELCGAIKSVYQATRSIVEPAGALAMAGLKRYIRENGVSGQSLVAINSGANMNFERLYRFWFPERPGALSHFLADMAISWNISLFHYRTLGSDFGRVLIGLEIPDGDEKRLSLFFEKLGYRYVEETEDPAYRLFL